MMRRGTTHLIVPVVPLDIERTEQVIKAPDGHEYLYEIRVTRIS